jgi:hypothetical protein
MLFTYNENDFSLQSAMTFKKFDTTFYEKFTES